MKDEKKSTKKFFDLSLSSLPSHHFNTSRILTRRFFLVYRFIMMTYVLVTLGLTFRGFEHALPPRRPWFVWFTNWSYLFSTLHFVLSFGILFSSTNDLNSNQPGEDSRLSNKNAKSQNKKQPLERKSSKDEKESCEEGLPVWWRLDWLCFTISCTLSLLVTLVFFVALFPQKKIDFIPPGDLITHLFNSVIMQIDLFLCSLPIFFTHLPHVLVVGFVFLVFSVLHWLQDPPNNFLYRGLLDWNHPQRTLIASAFIFFVIVPLLHTFNHFICKLKNIVFDKIQQCLT